MAGSDSQASEDQEREPDSYENEPGAVDIQGECHCTSTQQLYAVRIVFPAAAANNIAALEDVLHGISSLSGLECSVSLGPTSRGAAWDGHHRV